MMQAQLPGACIYRLFPTSDNIFPMEHYTRYMVNPGRFYEVNLVPHKGIAQYGLRYALAAIDTATGIMKIALLRDTVSKSGKEKLKQLVSGGFYNGRRVPVFAQAFPVTGDCVSPEPVMDGAFPDHPDIEGQWRFGRSFTGYSNLLAFIVLPPLRGQLQRYDSSSRSSRYGNRFTFEESFFYPHDRRAPYRNLIFTFDHDGIPLYKSTMPHTPVMSRFRRGEYIAVRRDSADWLFADRIIIQPDTAMHYIPDTGLPPNDSKLQIKSGWVKKEDLVTNPWIKQKQQTRQFRFEISCTSAGPGDEPANIEAIRIINKRTGKRQVIFNKAFFKQDPADVVQVRDCNFDGHPDIWLSARYISDVANISHDYHIYNAHSGQFEYNKQLSNLSNVEIDPARKCISTDWRGGAGYHGGEQYIFVKDTLQKVFYWSREQMASGYFAENRTGKLVNGNWVEEVYPSGRIFADSSAVYNFPVDIKKPVGKLVKDDYAFIRKETPLWYYVEAVSNTQKDIKGWIRKEAMLPGFSLQLKSETLLFRFEAADTNTIVAIRILNKAARQPMQIITGVQYPAVDSLFQTGDYNADGLPDFRIETNRDEQRVYYDEYLFDNVTQLFRKKEE
ncbi:hypothetical protein A8C56_20965 [Niabella ginsenosidivorans]|uniref:Uncharacterized protein n=2 Tax=Niabella ginsenosidivorans TaxID=1176587 RepID=A0A1A9I8T0_9BACT|nr:hypothetical protein A8C56_20965 [Niabella ginsenosidivorans]